MYVEEIGKRFRQRRLDMGLYQEQVASDACLSRYTIRLIEKGFVPCKSSFLNVCRALNTTPEDILNGTGYNFRDMYGEYNNPISEENKNSPARPGTLQYRKEHDKREQIRLTDKEERARYQSILPLLTNELKVRGISLAEVARRLGVNYQSLYRSLTLIENPSAKRIQKYLPDVCKCAGIPYAVFAQHLKDTSKSLCETKDCLIQEITSLMPSCDVETLLSINDIIHNNAE